MGLTFDIPRGFTYEAGQYILVGWRGEWHPFTLTSAPQEPHLSVHIRAPSSLDWCSALRRRLLVEAPAQAAGEDATKAKEPKETLVKYVAKVCPDSRMTYCQPAPPKKELEMPSLPTLFSTVTGRATEASKAKAAAVETGTDSPSTLEKSPSTSGQLMPKDAVVLQLCGPFGAPAQKVWDFETVMIVGAGIGVTPFASILRSVQLRAKQREAILRAVGRKERDFDMSPSNSGAGLVPATQSVGGFEWLYKAVTGADAASPKAQAQPQVQTLPEQRQDSRDEIGIRHLMNSVVKVPRRVYFYWIVRSQEELDWFADLLKEAVEGPAKNNVVISIFLTGEIELKQVNHLSWIHHHNFGRPNWGRIFKQVREDHKGEHVGVFLCGSPVIGTQLAHQSDKNTDPPSVVGGTRFSFFKEHF